MKIRTLLALVVTCLAAVALPLAQTPPPRPAAQTPVPSDPGPVGDYRIGIGDKLNIEVSPFSEFSKAEVLVQAGGTITVKSLDPVRVATLTAHEVEDTLAKAWLAKGEFSRLPQVTVTVTDFHSQRVIIQGEVRTPGEQTLKGNDMTLTRAILQAGGMSPVAGSKIEVRHTPEKTASDPSPATKATTYLRKELESGAIPDPPLSNGDIIIIEKAPVYYVNGYVKAGGEKIWEPGMTVGKALTIAGGVTSDGSKNGLKIHRWNDKKKDYEDIGVKEKDPVLPNDEVVVRKKLM